MCILILRTSNARIILKCLLACAFKIPASSRNLKLPTDALRLTQATEFKTCGSCTVFFTRAYWLCCKFWYETQFEDMKRCQIESKIKLKMKYAPAISASVHIFAMIVPEKLAINSGRLLIDGCLNFIDHVF